MQRSASTTRQITAPSLQAKPIKQHGYHNARYMHVSRHRQHMRLVTVKSQAAEGTLISQVEIPAFIPRADISDQLLRWALIEIQEGGVANVGCPCKVTAFNNDDGVLMGFTVSFMKDGESATDVRVAFDNERTMKHEWVGRGAGLLPSEMIIYTLVVIVVVVLTVSCILVVQMDSHCWKAIHRKLWVNTLKFAS